MIVQFFPRINVVQGLAYSVNTTGALEIIPKPSGMGVFTQPTILSTHAVKDEFLANEEYDTNGLRRMLTDQGFECVMIEHSLHGRYIQVGKQKRDGYTRYAANYQNPTAWNPPRPWSCRVKEDILQVVELCISMPKETHACFVGKASGTDVRNTVDFSPRIEFQDVRVKNVIPVTTFEHRRYPVGSLDLSSSIPDLQSQSFSSNLAIVLENSEPSQGYATKWKTLADELVDASIDDPETLIPLPSSLKEKYRGMVYCLPFPNGAKYVGELRWDVKAFDVKPFLKYEGDGRLGPRSNTSTFPILTNDITAFGDWKDDTEEWVPGVKQYRTCRTECLFEWPVVVYTPSGGGSVKKDNKPLLTEDQFENSRPMCFVPLMVRFVPADGYHGPIDHKSGRRLCMGSAIFAFICSMNPSRYYTSDTKLSLSMVQIRWPITVNPLFDEDFDLARRMANYTQVPEVVVKEELTRANQEVYAAMSDAARKMLMAVMMQQLRAKALRKFSLDTVVEMVTPVVEKYLAAGEITKAEAELKRKIEEESAKAEAELKRKIEELAKRKFSAELNAFSVKLIERAKSKMWWWQTNTWKKEEYRIDSLARKQKVSPRDIASMTAVILMELYPNIAVDAIRTFKPDDFRYVMPIVTQDWENSEPSKRILEAIDDDLLRSILKQTDDEYIFKAVNRTKRENPWQHVRLFVAMGKETRERMSQRLVGMDYKTYYNTKLYYIQDPNRVIG